MKWQRLAVQWADAFHVVCKHTAPPQNDTFKIIKDYSNPPPLPRGTGCYFICLHNPAIFWTPVMVSRQGRQRNSNDQTNELEKNPLCGCLCLPQRSLDLAPPTQELSGLMVLMGPILPVTLLSTCDTGSMPFVPQVAWEQELVPVEIWGLWATQP